MKTAAEWVERLWKSPGTYRSFANTVPAIQADAFTAGAEAQREADAKLFEDPPDCNDDLVIADIIRDNPLVTLPKGEE